VNVLLTGFGPFPGVPDNPTAALVRELDGRDAGGHQLVGRVLPVSYDRGPAETIRIARDIGAVLVLGFGVAVGRDGVEVECVGVAATAGRLDVDGRCPDRLAGAERVEATVDVQRLASALDARLSVDAGRYVCNAWLHDVTSSLDVPVGFVHVPPASIRPERVLSALAAILV